MKCLKVKLYIPNPTTFSQRTRVSMPNWEQAGIHRVKGVGVLPLSNPLHHDKLDMKHSPCCYTGQSIQGQTRNLEDATRVYVVSGKQYWKFSDDLNFNFPPLLLGNKYRCPVVCTCVYVYTYALYMHVCASTCTHTHKITSLKTVYIYNKNGKMQSLIFFLKYEYTLKNKYWCKTWKIV